MGQFGGGQITIWVGIFIHTKTSPKLVCCEGSKPHLKPVAISHNRANLGIVLMQNNATPHWLNNTTDDVEA